MTPRAILQWFEDRPMRVLLLPVAFLAAVYVLPLVAVMLTSFFSSGHFSVANYGDVFTPTFFTIVWRTIRISLVVTLACILLGYPYAYFIYRAQERFKPFLIGFVLIPFFTSILIRSYAWVALLGNRGLINSTLMALGITDGPVQMVYNEIGTLIGMGQILLPIMIMAIYGTMQRIDGSLLQAAESLGAHPLTGFWKVFVPLTFPGVAAGASLVFTSSLGFYVTPALLGGQGQYMVAQSIYAQLNSLNDIGGAATQATVLLLVVVALLLLLRSTFAAGTGSQRNASAVERSANRHISRFAYFPQSALRRLGSAVGLIDVLSSVLFGFMVALTLLLLSVTMLVVIPLGFSGDAFLRFPPHSFSLRWIESYLADSDWLDATYFSLWIGVVSSLLAGVTGAIAAYAMAKWQGRGRLLLELFFISPMIIPQFVIALALYVIFIKLGLIGNPITYILAYGVFGFPFVFLIMYATFQRFDFSLVNAAAVLGAKPLTIWFRIVVPLVVPSLSSALIFAFLTAFDDLVVALFFSSAGSFTLPMRMWDNIRNEISPQIAGVAVVFFAAALVIVATAMLARSLWRRTTHPAYHSRSA